MILLGLGIGLAFVAIAFIYKTVAMKAIGIEKKGLWYGQGCDDSADTLFKTFSALVAAGVLLSATALVAAFVILGPIINYGTLEARLELYQSENQVIQRDIADAVEAFAELESLPPTLQELKETNPTTLAAMFPDLWASELMQMRLEAYVENNNRIRRTREQMMSAQNYRWWLYFGR